MSIVNLGLQCIGVMRKKGSDNFEKSIANRNSPNMKEEVLASLPPPIDFLNGIFKRLLLKGKQFELYNSTSAEEKIETFWEVLLLIDSSLSISDNTKKSFEDKPIIKSFIEHCCKAMHFSFQVKRCGKTECKLFKPLCMPVSKFESIKFLPDPIPDVDGHYKTFADVYGSTTTEEHRPSLIESQKKKAHHVIH